MEVTVPSMKNCHPATHLMLLSIVMVMGVGLSACGGDERYFPPVQVTMTMDTAPIAMVRDSAIYWVEERYTFPFRQATQAEIDALFQGDPATLKPYDRKPFVMYNDIDEELDLTVSNLDAEDIEVVVTVNGINEFHEYVPGTVTNGEEVVPNFSGWERRIVLKANERRTLKMRIEDFIELERDLATVANGAPNFNLVMQFESQAGVDPRVTPYIPQTIPGVVGFRVGLQTEAAHNILLEAGIRLFDRNSRLADPDAEPAQIPQPAILMPMAMLE